MSTRLMAELDNARIVRFDPDSDTLLVWFGGHGVHVYAEDGTEVDYWTCGDFAVNSAFEDDVIASMTERLLGFDRMEEEAADLGAEHGRNAAAWIFDGDTPEGEYRTFLQGIEDGDPLIMDALPSSPLSGEFAGSPTPQSLMRDLGAHDLNPEQEGALCDAYEGAFYTAVEHTVVTTARRFLRMDDVCQSCGAVVYQDRTGSTQPYPWFSANDHTPHTCEVS